MSTTDASSYPYAPIKRTSAPESIVESLRALIVANELKAGDALPSERDLARQLSVSRNVLREALGILESKGLVEIVSGKGTFVALPSLANISEALDLFLAVGHVPLTELSEARLVIEPALAEMTARRITDAGVDELTQRIDALLSARTAEAHVEADIKFHTAIAKLSGSRLLEVVINAIRDSVTRSMVLGLKEPRALDHSDDSHRAIYHAIITRDPSLARQAMTDHLDYVRDYVAKQAIEDQLAQ